MIINIKILKNKLNKIPLFPPELCTCSIIKHLQSFIFKTATELQQYQENLRVLTYSYVFQRFKKSRKI